MTTHFLISLRSKVCGSHIRNCIDLQKRNLSSHEFIRHQNEVFNKEQKRQRDEVGRVEKIEVKYLGTPSDQTLMLNKNISTPYNIAQHISEGKCKSSVVALINNTTLWDLHRPIPDSCTVQLLNLKIKDASIVNKVYWRSCQFILGAVLSKSFKGESEMCLHSFPPANIYAGSFVHDISLKEANWIPNALELKTLGIEMNKFGFENHKIERLEVQSDIALDIFSENRFKCQQIPAIQEGKGSVTLYRVADHIDISHGPMMASTGLLGSCSIVASHKISSEGNENIYRVQGVAIPSCFRVSHFAMDNILRERAKKLNTSGLGFKSNKTAEPNEIPSQQVTSSSDQQVIDPPIKRKIAN